MGKAIYFLLVCIALSLKAGAVDCEALKKQKFKAADSTAIKPALAKLKTCGFDTIDLYYAMPPLVYAFIQKFDEAGRAELTYGDVVNIMQITRRMPQYAEQKARVKYQLENPRVVAKTETAVQTGWPCDTPNNGYFFKGQLPQEMYQLGFYFSYRQALECARKNNKKLLVYFTGISNANARSMEQTILSSDEVKRLLRQNYIVAVLVTDSKQEGEWLTSMQQKQFGTNTQPAFYILDQKEKKLAEMFYDTSVERFTTFLNKK